MKKIISISSITSFLLLAYAKVSYAAVCVNNLTKQTVPAPASGTCPADSTFVTTFEDFERIFATLVSGAGLLLGFTFFLMLIVGGMRYLLSGGDPKALQAAKGTITWAVIGLALFSLSFTILIIIQAFTGVQVTIFNIGN